MIHFVDLFSGSYTLISDNISMNIPTIWTGSYGPNQQNISFMRMGGVLGLPFAKNHFPIVLVEKMGFKLV